MLPLHHIVAGSRGVEGEKSGEKEKNEGVLSFVRYSAILISASSIHVYYDTRLLIFSSLLSFSLRKQSAYK
jgi:hypothetical protein